MYNDSGISSAEEPLFFLSGNWTAGAVEIVGVMPMLTSRECAIFVFHQFIAGRCRPGSHDKASCGESGAIDKDKLRQRKCSFRGLVAVGDSGSKGEGGMRRSSSMVVSVIWDPSLEFDWIVRGKEIFLDGSSPASSWIVRIPMNGCFLFCDSSELRGGLGGGVWGSFGGP